MPKNTPHFNIDQRSGGRVSDICIAQYCTLSRPNWQSCYTSYAHFGHKLSGAYAPCNLDYRCIGHYLSGEYQNPVLSFSETPKWP